jgi:hypothetical protein
MAFGKAFIATMRGPFWRNYLHGGKALQGGVQRHSAGRETRGLIADPGGPQMRAGDVFSVTISCLIS